LKITEPAVTVNLAFVIRSVQRRKPAGNPLQVRAIKFFSIGGEDNKKVAQTSVRAE